MTDSTPGREQDRQLLAAAPESSDDWDDATWAAWARTADRAHADRASAVRADRDAAVAAAVRRALERIADEWAAHCPDHSDADEVSMDCRCDDANELRIRAEGVREDAVAAATGEETHIAADDSDDPEHVDDCPGCEDQQTA